MLLLINIMVLEGRLRKINSLHLHELIFCYLPSNTMTLLVISDNEYRVIKNYFLNIYNEMELLQEKSPSSSYDF